MDSRKILEIYKLINDRSPILVSAWPTIADIPQGMVVLDTDGVVKRKIGDYLVDIQYNVIGSGPLASAPAASVDNLGLYYLETGDPLWPSGRLWLYRRGLANAGGDGVFFQAALSNVVKVSGKFTVVQFCTLSSTTKVHHLLAKGVVQASLKEVGIVVLSDLFYGQIGGISVTLPATTGPVKFTLSNNLTSFTLKANDKSVSGVPGAAESAQPVTLFRASDAQSAELFKCYGFDVYNGANADGSTDGLPLAASWRLDEAPGSAQVVDHVSGLTGTVTDASPTGFVGVPMLVPAQW